MLPDVLPRLLLAAAIGCGGNVTSTNGTVSGDAGVDAGSQPFGVAGMKPLTSYEWAGIQAEVCYQPNPFELSGDGGVAECSLVIPQPSSPGQSPYKWGCPFPDFVVTLTNSARYLVQTAGDCSAGGVIQDPSNMSSGVVVCPTTCSLIEQSGGGTLEVFVFCGICSNP